MNLQHERIVQMCDTLKLAFVAQGYGAAAQQAARDEIAYSDFLEALLREEMAGRTVRKQNMMTRLAGFPAIKTLEQFNYDFAKGVKRSQKMNTMYHLQRSNLRSARAWRLKQALRDVYAQGVSGNCEETAKAALQDWISGPGAAGLSRSKSSPTPSRTVCQVSCAACSTGAATPTSKP